MDGRRDAVERVDARQVADALQSGGEEAARAEVTRQLQEQLQDALHRRYVELAEVLFLSQGGNILDFSPGDPKLIAAMRAWDEQRAVPWHGLPMAEQAMPDVKERNGKRKQMMAPPPPSSAPLPLDSNIVFADHATGITQQQVDHVLKRAASNMGVMERVAALRLAGHWSDDLATRQSEPARNKTHWDYMMDECVWLAKEVAGERRWKQKQAKKVAVAARKGLQEMRVVSGGSVGTVFNAPSGAGATITSSGAQIPTTAARREAELKQIARSLSAMVQTWWRSIHELVIHKEQAAQDLRKRAAANKHLEQVVDQTAMFSAMVSGSMGQQQHVQPDVEDDDMAWGSVSDEDEMGTLLAAEADEDRDEVQAEVEALQREMNMGIEELMARYRRPEGSGEDGAIAKESSVIEDEEPDSRPEKRPREDYEEESDEDELGTLLAAEADENREEVQEEVDALQREMDMDIDELMARYRRTGSDGEEDVGGSGGDDDKVNNLVEEEDPDGPPQKRPREDYEEESDEDELGTLLAAEADENREEVQEEVDALQREMDMDIDELMARYRRTGSDEPEEEEEEEEDVGSSRASDDENVNEDDGDDGDDGDVENGGGSSSFSDDDNDVRGDNEPELYGTHLLLTSGGGDGRDIMEGAAREAQTAQPTGTTLATSHVRTPLPSLLRGPPLREYQHIGLDWLVAMYEKGLNGILADEMGLGKTVMTISLLAHLAERRGIWGPHLIVVPTSVLLNWEKEFKFWHPAFKILTYFGSQKQRQMKRQGWSRPGAFHICITTYNIILQDSSVFRRRHWQYLILDEAHNIRNFKSKRWTTLLALHARRRLLLTGTPLQNNLMELWSLLHFLMPHIFQSHSEFKEWFANPMDAMIDGKQQVDQALIDRLHTVLRPFLLRRLKKDVEHQLPDKHEHVVLCQLSKRQRGLYEEFLASRRVRDTLDGGNVVGVMNVLMQLRKVCNHPDLFEERPIISPYDVGTRLSVVVPSMLLLPQVKESRSSSWWRPDWPSWYREFLVEPDAMELPSDNLKGVLIGEEVSAALESPWSSALFSLIEESRRNAFECAAHRNWLRSKHDASSPFEFGSDVLSLFRIVVNDEGRPPVLCSSSVIDTLTMAPLYTFCIPRARSRTPELIVRNFGAASAEAALDREADMVARLSGALGDFPFDTRRVYVRQQLYFPDKRLIQYDCGKLQELALLLEKLQEGGHRVLIFTQMTRMLDVLETFLTFHHYPYLRLDGSTRTDRRYAMMERFNEDKRIFCFILSTRSGGLGINLTGADTVVFFDSDWNPAMDAQAQDRCHRIGQTRTVHIYRLISAKTVEENILRKAWQKRQLERVTLAEGGFNMSSMGASKVDLRELIGDGSGGSLTSASTVAAPKMEMSLGDDAWAEALAAVEDDVDRDAAAAAIREEAEKDAVEFAAAAPSAPPAPADECAVLEQRIMSQLDPVQQFALRFWERDVLGSFLKL